MPRNDRGIYRFQVPSLHLYPEDNRVAVPGDGLFSGQVGGPTDALRFAWLSGPAAPGSEILFA